MKAWRGAVLLTLLPGAALAQERRWELSPFIGGVSMTQDLGSVSNLFFTTTGTAQNVEFGKWFGIRAEYLFSPYVGLEANVARAENTYSFTVIDEELGTVSLEDQFEATQLVVGANVVVQFPLESGFVPYGTVGFGLNRTEPEVPIPDLEDVLASDISIGGGAKYFFGGASWLGLRFDLRYHTLSEGLAFTEEADSPASTEVSFGGIVRF